MTLDSLSIKIAAIGFLDRKNYVSEIRQVRQSVREKTPLSPEYPYIPVIIFANDGVSGGSDHHHHHAGGVDGGSIAGGILESIVVAVLAQIVLVPLVAAGNAIDHELKVRRQSRKAVNERRKITNEPILRGLIS